MVLRLPIALGRKPNEKRDPLFWKYMWLIVKRGVLNSFGGKVGGKNNARFCPRIDRAADACFRNVMKKGRFLNRP